MLTQDGKVGDDYTVTPIERHIFDKTCPHCDSQGNPTNRYLYRCTNPNCGRYW